MSNKNIVITRGEIWVADLNYMNTRETSVQQGTRAVIIISNQKCNDVSPVVSVIPLTTAIHKRKLPTQVILNTECGLRETSMAMAEQQQSLDKHRLLFKVGEVTPEKMQEIITALQIQMGLIEPYEIKQEVKQTKVDYELINNMLDAVSQSERMAKKLNINLTNKTTSAKRMFIEYCKTHNLNVSELVDMYKNNKAQIQSQVRDNAIKYSQKLLPAI